MNAADGDSTDRPAPLVPTEADLRDFAYMELDVRRLRDSRFGAEVSGDAFRAGVMLWCASWHQVPAGSVPDDDVELANLAGYGRFVKEWKKTRAEALQGFVKCSDGRLYHPVVAEKANAAWTSKLRHHYDRACDRLRKANKTRKDKGQDLIPELTFEAWNESRIVAGLPMEKAEASAGIPQNRSPAGAGIPPENALRGRRNGEGEGEGDSLFSEPGGSGAGAPLPDADPMTPKDRLWALGTAILGDKARSLIGKHVSTYGEEAVLAALQACNVEQPGEPKGWLTKALEARAKPPPRASRTPQRGFGERDYEEGLTHE